MCGGTRRGNPPPAVCQSASSNRQAIMACLAPGLSRSSVPALTSPSRRSVPGSPARRARLAVETLIRGRGSTCIRHPQQEGSGQVPVRMRYGPPAGPASRLPAGMSVGLSWGFIGFFLRQALARPMATHPARRSRSEGRSRGHSCEVLRPRRAADRSGAPDRARRWHPSFP